MKDTALLENIHLELSILRTALKSTYQCGDCFTDPEEVLSIVWLAIGSTVNICRQLEIVINEKS